MKILAHRGNITGPNPVTENSLPAFRAALARGWGLEIDVRHTGDARLYISHDACSDVRNRGAEDCFAAIREFPGATIAVNVKETGHEFELLSELTRHGVLGQSFLFDMELVEPHRGETARVFRALNRRVKLAARVSDRDEPVDRAVTDANAAVVWLDEFDGPWCGADDVQRLKAAGKTVYVVSPELHGGTLGQARSRWIDFWNWQVDGICTDFPAELEATLAHLERTRH